MDSSWITSPLPFYNFSCNLMAFSFFLPLFRSKNWWVQGWIVLVSCSYMAHVIQHPPMHKNGLKKPVLVFICMKPNPIRPPHPLGNWTRTHPPSPPCSSQFDLPAPFYPSFFPLHRRPSVCPETTAASAARSKQRRRTLLVVCFWVFFLGRGEAAQTRAGWSLCGLGQGSDADKLSTTFFLLHVVLDLISIVIPFHVPQRGRGF